MNGKDRKIDIILFCLHSGCNNSFCSTPTIIPILPLWFLLRNSLLLFHRSCSHSRTVKPGPAVLLRKPKIPGFFFSSFYIAIPPSSMSPKLNQLEFFPRSLSARALKKEEGDEWILWNIGFQGDRKHLLIVLITLKRQMELSIHEVTFLKLFYKEWR